MAFAGLLLGMVAGLITASIGYIALDLSILICLLIYSFVGALSTFVAQPFVRVGVKLLA